MGPEEDAAPVHVVGAAWEAWAQSVRGRVRAENQDAWAVRLGGVARLGPSADPVPGGAARREEAGGGVVGIFDGLGGHAHGRAAARAAANALLRLDPLQVEDTELLRPLDAAVRATGGLTTAVVVLVPALGEDRLVLVSSGDSSAYARKPNGAGGVERVSRRDRGPDGRVTACLGLGERAEGARVLEVDRLVLVTDGVDSYLPPSRLASLLTASRDAVSNAISGLLRDVEEVGAPDNATVLLLRRRRREAP